MAQPPSNRTVTPAPLLNGVVLALATLYIIWGSTYLAIRFAVETIPPYTMLAGRFLVAGGLLYGVLRLRGTPNPSRREWLASGVVGTLLLVGGMGSVSLAQSLGVSSGMSAVVVSTMPLWFALFARFWGERVGVREYGGMAVGLIGVALLNAGSDLRSNPLAAALLFIAPVSWAFGSVLSRRLRQAPGLMASALQMATASAGFILFALVRGERLVQPPSLGSSLALLYLITFGSLLAYSAYVYLLSRPVRPALLSSYAYVNPVVAVFLGVGLAGETLTPLALVGVAVILTGVVLAVTASRPAEGSRT